MSEPNVEGSGIRPAASRGPRIDRRRLRWPRVIADIAAAATEGSQAVAEAGVRAARPLLAADAAAIVRWQDGHPVVLAADGDVRQPFSGGAPPRVRAGRTGGRSPRCRSIRAPMSSSPARHRSAFSDSRPGVAARPRRS